MAEEGRARSRSRGREAAEYETPDMPEGTPGVPEEAQGMPEGTPGDMAAVPGMPEGTPGDMAAVPGMPEGTPGDMTAAPPLAPTGMEILNLSQRISECATRIGSVTEDLAITLDHFNHGRDELKKGFQELSTQIKNTAHCITTMTSGVSFQAGETTKLLKAFDRWATTGRWALAGSQSVETNIQGVQGEVEKQAKKLEASLNSGFESLGGHIQELVKLLREQPQGMAMPAAIPMSEGATETGTPLTPGAIGAPAVGAPVMGAPGSTGRAGSTSSGGVPLPGTGSISSGEVPLPGSAPGAHGKFCHLRRCQCRSLWRSVRNSRMGRDQVLPFRSQHRASVRASLPEMRGRRYRGHCHRRHIALNNSLESPVPGLPRDWG